MINLNIISVDLRKGFPSSSSGQEFACNARNLGLTPGSGRSSAGGCDVQGQGQKLGGPHALRAAAKRNYPVSKVRGDAERSNPMPKARGSSQEEQPKEGWLHRRRRA